METMQNAMCIVLTNLKAKKLGGFPSHGMVLCGETPDKSAVELITPPAGSQPGDVITIEGQPRSPVAEMPQKAERNPWFRLEEAMVIDGSGVAKWGNHAYTVEGKGNCTTSSIKNGIIH